MSLLNKLFVYSEYELRTRRYSLSLGNSVFVEHPNIFCRTHKIFSVHMMTQGAAQQSGRQMGMTAAPPFSPLSSLDLAPLSAAYEALKYCPWALSSASRAFTSSLFLVYRSPDISHIIQHTIVKLRQGSGKDRQGMALKAKGLKLKLLPRAYTKVGCQLSQM